MLSNKTTGAKTQIIMLGCFIAAVIVVYIGLWQLSIIVAAYSCCLYFITFSILLLNQ